MTVGSVGVGQLGKTGSVEETVGRQSVEGDGTRRREGKEVNAPSPSIGLDVTTVSEEDVGYIMKSLGRILVKDEEGISSSDEEVERETNTTHVLSPSDLRVEHQVRLQEPPSREDPFLRKRKIYQLLFRRRERSSRRLTGPWWYWRRKERRGQRSAFGKRYERDRLTFQPFAIALSVVSFELS